MEMRQMYQAPENRLATSNTFQYSESTNSTPSQPESTTCWKKLKTNQWNADGLCPNFLELRNLLINSDIDVLAVQE